jgi:hypothetical protein
LYFPQKNPATKNNRETIIDAITLMLSSLCRALIIAKGGTWPFWLCAQQAYNPLFTIAMFPQ